MIFELTGTIGSLIVCMSAFPQIAKTYRTRKADDLSISCLLILLAGIILMTLYSHHIGNPLFIFGNILSVVSTGILIVLWLRYGAGHGETGRRGIYDNQVPIADLQRQNSFKVWGKARRLFLRWFWKVGTVASPCQIPSRSQM